MKKKRNVGLIDLPALRASMRAEFLFEDFHRSRTSDRLWRTLFAAHYKKYLVQWFLVFIVCFLQFLPQLFLLQILSGLEARDEDSLTGRLPFVWVIGLGSSIAINSWIEVRDSRLHIVDNKSSLIFRTP